MPQDTIKNNTHKQTYPGISTVRDSFSKIKTVVEMPYLLESQMKSYDDFIKNGIREVLDYFSPVTDKLNKITIEYGDYRLDETPKFSIKDCKMLERTYSAPLRVRVKITRNESGEMIEDEVYMGEIPLITSNGSFIINGSERVVVSQLKRSPGVYCETEKDKAGVSRFSTRIMPETGAWVDFNQDSSDIVYVTIDKKKKLPASILIRAIVGEGTSQEVLDKFNNDPLLAKTLEKDLCQDGKEARLEIYKRQHKGETPTDEAINAVIQNLFLDPRRYDLMRVGRYKINKKLAIAYRIDGKIASRDIVSDDGEILVSKDEKIDTTKAWEIQNVGINEVYVKDDKQEEFKVIGNNTVDLQAYCGIDPKEVGILERVYLPVLKDLMEQSKDKKVDLKTLIKDNTAELVIEHLTIDDILSAFNYNIGLPHGVGVTDIIDHLANRRVRCVGELLKEEFYNGMSRLDKQTRGAMAKTNEEENFKIQNYLNVKPVSAAITEFFNTNQLSQFMDQHNPIAELTNKRKLSALGKGGLDRQRASFKVRDINYTHYGRLCPLETPEGQNIGLISSLAGYAKINEYGFIETPYRKVDKATGVVTDEIVYLQADEEDNYTIAQANTPLTEDNKFASSRVTCRIREDIREVDASQTDFMDVSPKQLISVATALIPFLENDDTARALMASNMQRQAVPLLRTEAPLIATGIEQKIAKDSGVVVVSNHDGVVDYISGDEIIIDTKDCGKVSYKLQKFERTNNGTCINHKPIVSKGQSVKKGDVLADGPATKNGELSLGRNILVGYMSWEGYNYEDAILINEDLVKDDVFTTIHIEKFEVAARKINNLGSEEITSDIPKVKTGALRNLDERGIIRIGSEVNSRDYLVGKITPKGETEPTAEEKLLRAILGKNSKDAKDSSLRLPHGQSGVVVDVQVFTKENNHDLDPGVEQLVRVYVAQKRKIGVGDKMSGRHGNKGVISRVLPREDMPFLEDGTRLQIVLNPLGVPSRMNIGQVLEVHLGYVAKKLGLMIETPVFDGATKKDVGNLLKENGLPENGKFKVYDGRTGEAFENPVTVGYMYMLKLCHLVDEKMHARSTGPYALITRQPLGGKANNGGQRFGEMEVWALEGYGAAHTLQEVLTIKSDDTQGRTQASTSILENKPFKEPGVPESFKVLLSELKALCLDVRTLNERGEEVAVKNYTDYNSITTTNNRKDSTYSSDVEPNKEIDPFAIDTPDFDISSIEDVSVATDFSDVIVAENPMDDDVSVEDSIYLDD